ncbi:SusC/RagA family TonB-linked outer membrane protein [Flavihumibacter petaseus]|uniref:Putative TonB-dependent receptor n=1 Tax=Flavihumibacter petaseus NBRC 106054 TaxID=1220578 RepID=A0A0E9MZL2_9BACT|nr:SusC/RagA family TonB-linked outer membrane protein [Flavihumibacter petaseus]GAO42555.1 putative TonB-dependent receptor [Flavihumibacter petaseus NBRC 106054]
MKKLLPYLAALLFSWLWVPSLLAQQKTISGKVTDNKGNPIPNATVTVEKTNRGTMTDAAGQFSLEVPENSNLVISYTGFRNQVIPAAKLASGSQVTLVEDVAKLDEVVVTGLATSLKRRNLANAVVSISSNELNGVAPAQTFDAALNGKIPGAYINANTGAPGGGLSVKLRGVTSVYGNTQPLYVVDGVFVDNTATSAGINTVTGAASTGATSTQDNPSSRIADIRAEDIENVEILKGASAAAIYGSKAAGGVIIITTKRGKQGRTRVNISQDLGVISARKLLGVRKFDADKAASLSSDPATSEALRQQFIAAEAAGKIYDYEKEVYGNKGFARNTTLSLNGGSEKTGFFFSASQKAEDGIVKRTGYRNTSLRLNLDHKLTDNIKIGIATNYINSSADRSLTGNDNAGVTLGIALSSTPGFAELHPDENGKYPNNTFAASNPLQTVALMRNNESVNRFLTGLTLDATLQKSDRSTTRFIGRGGFDFYQLETNALFPAELQFQTVNKGTSMQGNTQNLNTNFILSLVNQFRAGEQLNLTTSAGITQEKGDYNNLLNVATQVITDQSNVSQAGALSATQFRTKFQNSGFFIQEEALIRDGITVTGGVRFDQSSNNGDASKYYAYPKAGLSVNLTRLNVIKQGVVEDFKLRAAYGQANNTPAYGSKFTSMVVSNIQGYPGSLVNIQRGNPDIKPEKQTELETGFDIAFLGGKLGLSATYYNKKIYDFLMLAGLPASSGFSTQWTNAGDLQNQGVEIGINAKPVSNRKVNWNTSVNFWLNRSKVTKLTVPSTPLGSFGYVLGTYQIEEGKSATQLVGLNGQGVGVLGDAEPDFQMNSYNEVTFFNKLSLRFLLHWKKGGENVNLTSMQNDFGGTSADYDDVTNDKGLPDGVYRIMQVGSTAEVFVKDASYFRVREIALYYNFGTIPSIKFVKGLRVGASLNNYITITNYKAYDPEVSNFGTGFSSGIDVLPYPASKRATFHISIDF